MKKKILQIVSIVILILAIVGLLTTFKPCVNDKAMKCNASVSTVILIFATSIVIRVISFIRKKKIHISYIICTILLSIDAILIPNFVVGGCKIKEMACHIMSFPFINVITIILIIVDLVQIILNRKIKE